MGETLNTDLNEMIEINAGRKATHSPEELEQAMRSLSESEDEEKLSNPWIKRYNDLPAYTLDVIRDGSDAYIKALTDAILAITKGEYGSIDYKGYKVFYTDTPHVKSISLEDGHKEYSYEVSFRCEALMAIHTVDYHSEEERQAFLDPKDDNFQKTIALLDKEIELLDEGTWIKAKKTLNVYDFKDYSPDGLKFKRQEWDDINNEASKTLSFLADDAFSRAKAIEFTEDDFNIFAEIIRRMVFFADYEKRNDPCSLQGFIWFEWKPKTKRDRYIWRCMDEYGQGDIPDRLLDNCSLYYLLDDPQGWEAVAYLLPITALWIMCADHEPDNVKNEMLKIFDTIPDNGYRDRIEKLIEEDRAKADKGGGVDDQENI